jgi:hypothetical protein
MGDLPNVTVHSASAVLDPAAQAARAAGLLSPASAGGVMVVDAKRRQLTVRKLSVLEQIRVAKILGPQQSMNIPVVGIYRLAASVTAIDGVAEAFPASERQIEAMIQRLGDEGIEAVSKCYKDQGWVAEESGDPDEIKNS